MKNNILGGLVIFMVVVTCLLLLDDITNPYEQQTVYDNVQVDQRKNQTDLAILEDEE
ncbi:hypothetical protein ITJ86_07960 [Winogradskyella sp. F6397]|uniref:Cytochrome C oxidase Cbb3 n=1 Tax=Winogradskyella marina TaxID=2785530 RepID=A0ABS0EM91_9FLAO|nr:MULTISPECIES: hypothetical protein [Winogradskyella]MBF8149831.1 hypothetical protein [Winogradskyella marina]